MYIYQMNLKDKYQKWWFENMGDTLNSLSIHETFAKFDHILGHWKIYFQ